MDCPQYENGRRIFTTYRFDVDSTGQKQAWDDSNTHGDVQKRKCCKYRTDKEDNQEDNERPTKVEMS